MLFLATRQDLRNLFFKVTGTDTEDEALAEHFSAVGAFSAADAAAHFYLHAGLWSAQHFYIDSLPGTSGTRWLTSAAPAGWTPDGFGQYTPLPDGSGADLPFLRLAGDVHESAIVRENAYPWGKLIDARENARHRTGAVYWLQNDRLYIPAEAATPPSDARIRYYYRHATIEDADDEQTGLIEFPVEDRPLIVAFAAWHAFDAGTLVDEGAFERVQKSLVHWKGEVASRARRTRAPRSLRATQVHGNSII